MQSYFVPLGLLVALIFSCLLGARARTSKQEKSEAHTGFYNTDRQMIVAASCGTKNNNASLQSNN